MNRALNVDRLHCAAPLFPQRKRYIPMLYVPMLDSRKTFVAFRTCQTVPADEMREMNVLGETRRFPIVITRRRYTYLLQDLKYTRALELQVHEYTCHFHIYCTIIVNEQLLKVFVMHDCCSLVRTSLKALQHFMLYGLSI